MISNTIKALILRDWEVSTTYDFENYIYSSDGMVRWSGFVNSINLEAGVKGSGLFVRRSSKDAVYYTGFKRGTLAIPEPKPSHTVKELLDAGYTVSSVRATKNGYILGCGVDAGNVWLNSDFRESAINDNTAITSPEGMAYRYRDGGFSIESAGGVTPSLSKPEANQDTELFQLNTLPIVDLLNLGFKVDDWIGRRGYYGVARTDYLGSRFMTLLSWSKVTISKYYTRTIQVVTPSGRIYNFNDGEFTLHEFKSGTVIGRVSGPGLNIQSIPREPVDTSSMTFLQIVKSFRESGTTDTTSKRHLSPETDTRSSKEIEDHVRQHGVGRKPTADETRYPIIEAYLARKGNKQ